MFEKNKRIVDKKAIENARKEYCEICGRTDMAIEVHHVEPKGFSQTGGDVPENLVSACILCHRKVHNGQISKDKLYEIVRCRCDKSSTSNRFTF